MDEASLMNLLTTAPPMAAFAGYLVYQTEETSSGSTL